VFGRVSDRLHGRLVLQALEKDITMRRPPKGLIHYSDRGSQYCSLAHQAELKANGITETLKSELI